MKPFAFALSLVLLAGVLGSAVPAAEPVPVATLWGIEISPGIKLFNVRYGTAFIGTASGNLSGTWAVTFNYTPPNPGAGAINYIKGGSWTLYVYQGGVYKGKLYGSITGGEAHWDDDGSRAHAWVNLKVLGGTGAYFVRVAQAGLAIPTIRLVVTEHSATKRLSRPWWAA